MTDDESGGTAAPPFPQPRTDLATEFLQRWKQGGSWVLCAIDPIVKGKIETRTFRENSLAEMVKWLDSHQGISNLYFTVNTIAHDMNIKPKKTDIAAGTHLFVDCDPRVGEDPAEAKVRILKTLQNFSLTPTLIIDSGNGYQAYWKLTKSVMLDGTEAAAEDYEAYNRQLEFLFDGDHCHNADRLMRLPGTINMPTETKKRKGRVPVLASVLEWHDDRIYDLSQFTPAPSLRPSANSSGDNEVKVNISSDLTHVCVDDLAAKNINVPDPIKILIVHGHNPDNPSLDYTDHYSQIIILMIRSDQWLLCAAPSGSRASGPIVTFSRGRDNI